MSAFSLQLSYFLVTLRTKRVQVVEAQSYSIVFQGLSTGRHEFRFEVGKSLFEEFGSSEIKDGKCEVIVELERTETLMLLDIRIMGHVVVPCDRCLEDCNVPIHFEGRLEVRFSDEEHEYDGEVLWLFPGETTVDLSQYIYESIVLSLPYQRVHSEGECDPDMLRRFRIVSQDEFESLEADAGKATPARGEWSKLAALRDRMAQESAEEPSAGAGAAEEIRKNEKIR